jgi:hypothetical protein
MKIDYKPTDRLVKLSSKLTSKEPIAPRAVGSQPGTVAAVGEGKSQTTANSAPVNNINAGQYRQNYNQSGGAKSRIVTCFYCHKKGHRADECKLKKSHIRNQQYSNNNSNAKSGRGNYGNSNNGYNNSQRGGHNANRRGGGKYCVIHNANNHNTDECTQVQNLMDDFKNRNAASNNAPAQNTYQAGSYSGEVKRGRGRGHP